MVGEGKMAIDGNCIIIAESVQEVKSLEPSLFTHHHHMPTTLWTLELSPCQDFGLSAKKKVLGTCRLIHLYRSLM
jgi:hypothetical protein